MDGENGASPRAPQRTTAVIVGVYDTLGGARSFLNSGTDIDLH